MRLFDLGAQLYTPQPHAVPNGPITNSLRIFLFFFRIPSSLPFPLSSFYPNQVEVVYVIIMHYSASIPPASPLVPGLASLRPTNVIFLA